LHKPGSAWSTARAIVDRVTAALAAPGPRKYSRAMLSLRDRRRTAWIAILAILLNAFAPALSHAAAARLGVTWLEICTQDGLKRVAVEYRGARPDIPPGAHVVVDDHCPYCAPHGASFAHSLPAVVAAAVLAGPAALAVDAPAALPQRAIWTSRHARAPPSIS
jgi:hypothetical protein